VEIWLAARARDGRWGDGGLRKTPPSQQREMLLQRELAP